MKYHVMLLGLLSLIPLLSSCEYKDLCYDHNHWTVVRVAFDWTLSPQADAKGMTTLFYNQVATTTEPVRYDYSATKGGMARLNPDNYQALAYNNDTETILFRDMQSLSTLQAYTRLSSIEEGTQLTRAGMPRAASTENEEVILVPDMLWAAVSKSLDLTTQGDTVDVTISPVQYVREITITIHNVPNLQYTGQFGGALSGLSPGVYMASNQLVEGSVTQAFPCSVIDENTLQMNFRIFGHCPHRSEGQTNPHLLTIYAILSDGSKWYYTQDVTSKMHDPVQNPDDYHVYIELDGLPVPKPIVNGSGFRPTIDGWQGEEIEVGM